MRFSNILNFSNSLGLINSSLCFIDIFGSIVTKEEITLIDVSVIIIYFFIQMYNFYTDS